MYITNFREWRIKEKKISDDSIYLILYNEKYKATFNYNRQDNNKIKKIFLDNKLIDLSNPKNDPLMEITTILCGNNNFDYAYNNKLTLDTLLLINLISK